MLAVKSLIALGLLLVFPLELHRTEAASILGVFPFRHNTGAQFVRPLLQALIERGHQVTMISPVNNPPDIEGIRHVRVPMLNEHIRSDLKNLLHSKWTKSILIASMLTNVSYAVLSDDGVRRLMADKSEQFDMIMLEATHLDALFGLAEFFNATLVGVSSMRINWHVDELAGNPSPSIYEPITPTGTSTDFSILGRFQKWIDTTEEWLLESLVLRPAQKRLFQQIFGYEPEKIDELRSRFALILINNHFSMGRVRANVPNIIEVGGMHLAEPAEPCDQELQRFLDESEHGVIYFSMGNEIRFKYLPDSMQQPLLESLSQLKQRVVWKSDASTMPNRTGNIYRMAVAPQRAILEHPKVQLFVTHGGLLSVMEAISSGVPMLGLPLFFDQFNNLHRVQVAGMAQVLNANSLNTDDMISAIQEMTENPKYAQRAKEMARGFRDRPMSPLDTAVWWTEYALRHHDASHMRLKEEELPFMLYYRLENLLPLGIRVGVVIISLVVLGLRLIQKQRNRRRREMEENRAIAQPIWFD
ncbi:hypothetical protein KR018_002702 [Drosophila ironensis]|nr:hypothetical protein KR018_002702 [Drosophila ironensis]